MSRYDRSDFEIGYEYVRRRYSFLANKGPQHLWELGTAFSKDKGVTAELSRGIGFYFLELRMQILHLEMTKAINKKDCV